MSSKRRATSQLTRDDLDREDDLPEQEEEEEDRGLFQEAQKETLDKRVIIKARRSVASNPGTPGVADVAARPSPFAGFNLNRQFTSTPNTTSIFSKFAQPPGATGDNMPSASSSSGITNGLANGAAKDASLANMGRDPVYYQKISSMNSTFHKLLNQHQSKEEHFDYTPMCKDYIKFAENLASQYPCSGTSAQKMSSSEGATITPPSSNSTPFASAAASFTFGGGSFNATSTPTFPLAMSKVPGLTFGSGAAFPVAGSSQGGSSSAIQETIDDDEAYEPPKPEAVQLDEKDAVYSKGSIKLYAMAKGQAKYEGKGKGTLFVKNVGSKHQLIFRAENTLGTILLNIFLSAGIPISIKKTNVMIVCVPNPPLSAKASSDDKETATYLIKCVNEAEAIELHEKLLGFRS